MSDALSIRLARPNEVARLGFIEDRASELFESTDIINDLNGEVFDPAELANLIAKQQVWVACDESDLAVGFVIVLKNDDVIHIEELDVLPELGRRGIGTALLEHVCRWGRDAGFIAATLSTFRDVPWNAPFYSRRGFRVIDPDEYTSWMVELRHLERSKGLRLETRVIMRRRLS